MRQVRQQHFFEDSLKDVANNKREADGPEFTLGLLCKGLLRLGQLLLREKLNIRASTVIMWEFRASWKSQSIPAPFKSKLLVLEAVNTSIHDHGCQHVTGRFESIRMLLSKQTG